MLDKPWDPVVDHDQQPLYQPVVERTYWTFLGYFNNCNIIKFTNKAILLDDSDEVHKVVLDGISGNMA